MAGDYIRRLVDLDAIIDCLEVEWGYEGIREDLYSLPVVDAAPVVRCKDCKYGELYSRNDGYTGVYCNCQISTFTYANDHTFTPVRNEDDFCSYGEYQTNTGDAAHE